MCSPYSRFPPVLPGGLDSRTLQAWSVDFPILSPVPTAAILTNQTVRHATRFGVGKSFVDERAFYLKVSVK